jgi:hypothetical protein
MVCVVVKSRKQVVIDVYGSDTDFIDVVCRKIPIKPRNIRVTSFGIHIAMRQID